MQDTLLHYWVDCELMFVEHDRLKDWNLDSVSIDLHVTGDALTEPES